MYTTGTPDERTLALKPMNCPGSVLMYSHGLKSYRDLPIRMAEFGKVHRYELSGALHGLLRVRHFTQDDAHIYCTENQMLQECTKIIRLVLDIYKQVGFDDVSIKLSTRPEKRMGDDDTWDILEAALIDSLTACGTLQVDMNLPSRFGLEYVDENGLKQTPVMLHRALFGSLERFIGILIEHYAGKFPAWLAPVQVSVLTISEQFNEYAERVNNTLEAAGLRAELDKSKEKVGYKIRQQTLQKVPFMVF